jgi:hypothetical protein
VGSAICYLSSYLALKLTVCVSESWNQGPVTATFNLVAGSTLPTIYRSMDVIMLSLFNSKERDEDDWIGLFKKADLRFSNVKIWRPEGDTMSLIEILWTGEE